jgi:hypothetical protein
VAPIAGFRISSKLDFVHFLEERTSPDACCKIETNQSVILTIRRLCEVPSPSHYSCSGSFSATVSGTNMEKSGVASRRYLDFPTAVEPSRRHCVRRGNRATLTGVNFHQVLNPARWSALEVSRRLLQVLTSTFGGGGTRDIVIDETLERRS